MAQNIIVDTTMKFIMSDEKHLALSPLKSRRQCRM